MTHHEQARLDASEGKNPEDTWYVDLKAELYCPDLPPVCRDTDKNLIKNLVVRVG